MHKNSCRQCPRVIDAEHRPCTLISKTEVEASYRHISTRLDEFPTAIGEVGAKLLDEKQRLQFSLESEVREPIATMKSFNRQFQLGKPEVEAVAWAWPQEQGEAMFHVIDAYTKEATAFLQDCLTRRHFLWPPENA